MMKNFWDQNNEIFLGYTHNKYILEGIYEYWRHGRVNQMFQVEARGQEPSYQINEIIRV